MLINVVGKQKALEDLERAEKLIREAHEILWKLPSNISLEISEGNSVVSDSDQDNR